MPTTDEAEEALDFLRKSAADVKTITKQARLKSHMLKHVEGLLVLQSNQPTTVKKECARAQSRWREAAEEEAEAYAEEAALEERRDTAKITISLYQTMMRDRL